MIEKINYSSKENTNEKDAINENFIKSIKEKIKENETTSQSESVDEFTKNTKKINEQIENLTYERYYIENGNVKLIPESDLWFYNSVNKIYLENYRLFTNKSLEWKQKKQRDALLFMMCYLAENGNLDWSIQGCLLKDFYKNANNLDINEMPFDFSNPPFNVKDKWFSTNKFVSYFSKNKDYDQMVVYNKTNEKSSDNLAK